MSEPESGFGIIQIMSGFGALITGGALTWAGFRKSKPKSEPDDPADELRLLKLQMELQGQAAIDRSKLYDRIDQFGRSIGESIRAIETRMAKFELELVKIKVRFRDRAGEDE